MNQRVKQILAIAGIVIIVAMYVVTLILSFSKNEHTQKLFVASIVCTIAIPLLLYCFIWFTNLVKKRTEEINGMSGNGISGNGISGNGTHENDQDSNSI